MIDWVEGAKTIDYAWGGNQVKEIPPSTDDSENNTTDTDNKKGDRNEPSKN